MTKRQGVRSARWFAAVVIVAACTPDEASEPASNVPPGTPVAIEPTPRLSVGVAFGDSLQEFDRVVTPFLLPNGQLVVPSRGLSSIRVFSSSGGYVETLGGFGEGPGEFTSLMSAWARGDTIEALDARLMRITRFPPDGSVNVVSLRAASLNEAPIGGPMAEGWFAGGVAGGAPMGSRDDMSLHRFARDGTDLGRVTSTPGMLREQTPGRSGPGPLSPRAVFAVSAGRLYAAETMTASIQVFQGTGPLEREITWVPAPPTSAAEMFAAVVDSAVSRAEADRADATRQRWEAHVIPERLSAFWAFLVDDEGFVWVRHYEALRHAQALGGFALATGGPGGVWTILSPDGVEVGTVQVPDDLEPVRITSDEVIGIAKDAFGVESVRVHPLRRS